MNKIFTTNDYLTEKLLGEILQFLFGDKVTPQFRIKHKSSFYEKEKLFIVDYKVEIGGKVYLFEFDGNLHYQNAKTIYRDKALREVTKDLGHTLINIPYFIQLSSLTLGLFFSNDLLEYCTDKTVISNYPHGFIDKKAILPCDYNSIGFDRFLADITKCISNEYFDVRDAISASLYDKKASISGMKLVIGGYRNERLFELAIDNKNFSE